MIGQIFLRVFGQSKIFSRAFGASQFRPKKFFGAFRASNNSGSPQGVPPTAPPPPPTALKENSASESEVLITGPGLAQASVARGIERCALLSPIFVVKDKMSTFKNAPNETGDLKTPLNPGENTDNPRRPPIPPLPAPTPATDAPPTAHAAALGAQN